MAQANEGKEAIEWVMAEGHFDNIRKKVMERLRHNEELKRYTAERLENSSAISKVDLQPNKKRILEELRKELEEPLLDRASKIAWKVMTDSDSDICRLIEDTVHEALCAIYEQKAMARAG